MAELHGLISERIDQRAGLNGAAGSDRSASRSAASNTTSGAAPSNGRDAHGGSARPASAIAARQGCGDRAARVTTS
ncbi:hypothetical protein [Parafrankia sp. EUN1f]|uniref:hypothetical protein n=1 Tax=Parafrankia sp. EUN1f TaxID=102897 RepID=UPI0001C477A0|nr:hypothetical protein [Parafrankia sp. EUN1f]EFC86827.1 hypothetical protein FrEUN1fDRAFT_0078 [Parafrankia sp. EUN1f]